MRLLIVVGATVLSSCSVGPSPAPPLANACQSLESLAAAVLDAVALRDEVRLRSLALNEQEFREHVWPELPAARPERNLPFSYVWGDLRQKGAASLELLLAR